MYKKTGKLTGWAVVGMGAEGFRKRDAKMKRLHQDQVI